MQQAATDWPASVAGLAAVAPNDIAAAVVLGCAALASLLCALGVHIAVSRVLFAMGREQVLPAWLGVLHPRWGTPWRAIGLDLVVWVLVAVVALVLTSREGQIALSGGIDDGTTGGIFLFTFLAGVGTPLVMAVYLMLGVAGFLQGRRTGQVGFQVVGALAAVVGGTRPVRRALLLVRAGRAGGGDPAADRDRAVGVRGRGRDRPRAGGLDPPLPALGLVGHGPDLRRGLTRRRSTRPARTAPGAGTC